MDEADSLADKIVILAKGQVVATGSSAFLKVILILIRL